MRKVKANTDKHDFSADALPYPEAKQDTRERTFRYVQAMPQWNGYLTKDLIDLCGSQSEILKMLLARNYLQPGQGMYKGVDRDPAVIAANQAYFAAEIAEGLCDFRCAEWNDVIRTPWASKATIFTFDGFDSVVKRSLRATLGPTLLRVKECKKQYGEALLYLNLSNRTKADLTGYLAYLSEALSSEALKVTITGKQVHVYHSNTIDMVSIWFRLGF